MKGERSRLRRFREIRENHKALGLVLVAAVIAPGLLALLMLWRKPSGCSLCQLPGGVSDPRLRGGPITAIPDTNVLAAPAVAPGSLVVSAPVAASNTGTPLALMTGSPPGAAANARPEFVMSGGEKYLSVSFAQLASFDFRLSPDKFLAGSGTGAEESGAALADRVPAAIRALNEKPVAVTGFMLPLQTADGFATDFLLLRNQSACCYGVMPRVNEWVVVRTAGRGVKPVMDTPVTVVGTFHVREQVENGKLAGIYSLDGDRLINPKE